MSLTRTLCRAVFRREGTCPKDGWRRIRMLRRLQRHQYKTGHTAAREYSGGLRFHVECTETGCMFQASARKHW